jgi:hypothetical protein
MRIGSIVRASIICFKAKTPPSFTASVEDQTLTPDSRTVDLSDPGMRVNQKALSGSGLKSSCWVTGSSSGVSGRTRADVKEPLRSRMQRWRHVHNSVHMELLGSGLDGI